MSPQTSHPCFIECVMFRQRVLNILRNEFGCLAHMIDCRTFYRGGYFKPWHIVFGDDHSIEIIGTTPQECIDDLLRYTVLDDVERNIDDLTCWWEREADNERTL